MRAVSAFIASTILTGCAPVLVSAVSQSLAPSAVTLSVDLPLIYVSNAGSAGVVPALGGSTPALGGSVPALGGSVPAIAGSAPALAGGTPALSGTAPSLTGTAGTDATSSQVVSATVTANYLSAATHQACSVMAPFTAIASPALHFTFNTSELSTTGYFRVQAYDQSTGPTDSTPSNSIGAERYQIVQVADTSNSPLVGDAILSSGVFNNYYYFTALNQNGSFYKLFKVNAAGGVTQVTNTVNSQGATDI